MSQPSTSAPSESSASLRAEAAAPARGSARWGALTGSFSWRRARPVMWTLWWNAVLPAMIFLVTLLPRLRLARSLDIVTDESVYIPTGLLDVRLLQAHDLSSYLWLQNYEAPALPKLIIGMGALYGPQYFGVKSGWLYGARLPAAWLSALTFVAVYALARPIFGKRASALGALALALSPWLAFFGALAYLDTYLLCFMTLAILLVWHATRRPWLYPVAGLFTGLAFASKYTGAALWLPIALYLIYHYAVAARRRPPWRLALLPLVMLLTVYLTDPTIWLNPGLRLWDSMLFQFKHASSGHDVFWNGGVWQHVPLGVGAFILIAKLSLFLTIPAALTALWGAWRVIRARRSPASLDERAAFTLFWLGGLLLQFGALPIVVGSHYVLPLAPATALAAAWGLTLVADAQARRWCAPLALRMRSWMSRPARPPLAEAPDVDRSPVMSTGPLRRRQARVAIEAALTAVAAVALIAPPAYGLGTVNQAEGYTAEWLNGENGSLQVAYPGYADAIQWIIAHSSGKTSVTLISTHGGLDYWMGTRQVIFPQRIRLIVGTPYKFPHSKYIIWPEHLVQRRFPLPANFNSMIVARIQGGATTYCYVLRWSDPGS